MTDRDMFVEAINLDPSNAKYYDDPPNMNSLLPITLADGRVISSDFDFDLAALQLDPDKLFFEKNAGHE